ncbi:hypothetical protein [Photorhabdus stackebrandtii]|uniref:hypothetical protein n=1 Tax=Photorhabdus stackebrandtii TaxID=1123042 RepID=UPI001F6083C8|nr:hypothetical protein [Photorhabdus stackebrandtii]
MNSPINYLYPEPLTGEIEIHGPVKPERAKMDFPAKQDLPLPGLPKQPLSAEEAARFEPVRSAVALEQAMKNQMDWLTAWRINRYAAQCAVFP